LKPIVGTPRASRFRLAIFGAGLITRNSHLPTALSLPDIEVVALVDPVEDRARELVTEFGIRPAIFGSVEEVIAKLAGSLDGAIVATPNHTHRAVAVPLLEAGISTFIEKPLAHTVEDAEAILAAAELGGAQIAIGHYQRFLDGPRVLRKLLGESYFGRVTRFLHQFGTAGGWPAMSAYTLKRESIGGGVLVVTGTHFLDRMLDLWGIPDDVHLRDDSLGGPESHCEGSVTYERTDGPALQGMVRYSKSVSLPAGLVLETEMGTVMLRDGFTDRVILVPRDRPDVRLQVLCPSDEKFPPWLEPEQRMLRDFVDAATQKHAPEVDGAQGLRLMRLLRRFYENRELLAEPTTTGGARA